MAIGVPFRVKSFFRPKSVKKNRSRGSHLEPEIKEKTQLWVTTEEFEVPTTDNHVTTGDAEVKPLEVKPIEVKPIEVKPIEVKPIDLQLSSPFFQKLPLEIRRMIYEYVWMSPQDHMFHIPNGRHIHFQEGRWYNVRCVMNEVDEDLEFIQKRMDEIHDRGDDDDHGSLELWQRRSSQTWGHRHWRCEERMRHPREARVDKRHFASTMVVCKRMFPEVMESIFESHQFHFNDLYSAYRFLVSHPPAFVSHIRHLDLTFNMSLADYSPFFFEDITKKKDYVRPIWNALADLQCLQDLRISLDIYDRGPWRTLPEDQVIKGLLDLKVVNNFTLELPPSLPIYNIIFHKEELNEEDGLPFNIVRRPAFRYWEFHPHEVERFRWDIHDRGNLRICWITLLKSPRRIPNPYLFHFPRH